jgi:hypothetical protein
MKCIDVPDSALDEEVGMNERIAMWTYKTVPVPL